MHLIIKAAIPVKVIFIQKMNSFRVTTERLFIRGYKLFKGICKDWFKENTLITVKINTGRRDHGGV